MNSSPRLNKYIALHTGVSRREADSYIKHGYISINGVTAVIGQHVSDGDIVSLKGQPIKLQQRPTYILFHKPPGYVCSRRPQGNIPTIYSLLPSELKKLKPVGRLDKNSSGLIILTNDGDFAYKMTHPSFQKQKTYIASTDKYVLPKHETIINAHRVVVGKQPSRLNISSITKDNRRNWEVKMSEGRNRQIRRTFAALGYIITSLHRTTFAEYSLGDIAPGNYKTINIP